MSSSLHVFIVMFSCFVHVSISIASVLSIVIALLHYKSFPSIRIKQDFTDNQEHDNPYNQPTPMDEHKAQTLYRARAVFAGLMLGNEAKAQDKKRMYYVMEMSLPDGNTKWLIERSYRDFRALRQTLMATTLYFQHLSFPPRSPLGHWTINHTKRTQGLLAFVTYILQHDALSCHPAVVAFFSMPNQSSPSLALPMHVPHHHENDTSYDITMWTDEQSRAIVQLQQLLPPDELYTCPIILHRYLQTFSWDVSSAQILIESIISWRQTSLPHVFDTSILKQELESGKIYVADFLDKEQSALTIVKLYKENTWSTKHYLYNIMYTIEYGLRNVSPVHRMSVVIDFTNYSLKYCPDMNIFQKMVQMVEKYYIHHLGRIYVVDLPWIYAKMLYMIKPLLNPTTRSKLVLLRTSELNDLDDSICSTDLLRHVGPNPTFEFNVYKYLKC
ncbi:hypothetical protein THRCLA_02592 [Thraustotheca clavata]|uniref:CRAL-TRIO domain-containing protein n=1 Tax=Thraustotheca clavata TaxID=74557 RepID=A0A1W0A4N8_9STRA|nr:hypothetical protein THRCLA_02592 [Thraustotheca clavata]